MVDILQTYTHRVSRIDDTLPTRIYVFKQDFDKAYTSIETPVDYLKGIVYDTPNPFLHLQWAIALFWQKNTDKMVDLVGYSDITSWNQNPESEIWVFKNGVYQLFQNSATSTPAQGTCGVGNMILGREEEHRRKTATIDEYFRTPPDFSGSAVTFER